MGGGAPGNRCGGSAGPPNCRGRVLGTANGICPAAVRAVGGGCHSLRFAGSSCSARAPNSGVKPLRRSMTDCAGDVSGAAGRAMGDCALNGSVKALGACACDADSTNASFALHTHSSERGCTHMAVDS